MVIPNLDLTGCKRCDEIQNCIRCDYSSKTTLEIHSLYPRIISAADAGEFSLKCRTCKSGFIVDNLGNCVAKIANCKHAVFGDKTKVGLATTFYTLNIFNDEIRDFDSNNQPTGVD